MIGVFVTFGFEGAVDAARVRKVAEEARPMFQDMPGLRYKFFTLDEAANRAVNFYAWDAEEPARRFFSEELLERVTSLYGVRPSVDYVEIAAVVDNAAP